MATIETVTRLIPFGKSRHIETTTGGLGDLSGRHLGRVIPASGAPLAAVAVYDAQSRFRETVVIFDKNGAALRTFSAPGAVFREIAWSPHGDRLAYVLEFPQEEHTTQLHVYDVRRQRSLPVAGEMLNVWPAFSNDGNILAWIQRPEAGGGQELTQRLIFHDIRSGAQRRLQIKSGEAAFCIRWSPTNDTLAFGITETGVHVGHPTFHRDLCVVTSEKKLYRLTDLGDIGRYAWAWSPDGHSIALTRNIATDQDARIGPTGVWIVDLKTKSPRQVGEEERLLGMSIENLCWHGGGKWLLLSAYRGPDRNLYNLDVTTRSLVQLTKDNQSEYGEFWPAAGGVVFTRNGSEVWTCQLNGSRVVRIL